MAQPTVLTGDVFITGNLEIGGTLPDYPRTDLTQDTLLFDLPLEKWRIFDAFATPLAVTALSADDLSLVGGTHGTDAPMISTLNIAGANSTKYARCTFRLPPEYVSGETVTLYAHAGMKTAAASVSCAIDFAVYELNSTTAGSVVSGSDICATAAQSINSTTWATFAFTITPTDLIAGDVLDILLSIAYNDGGAGTVIGACRVAIGCTIKG